MVRLPRVLVVSVLCVIAATIPAAGQQRGSVSGRILDAGGLVLPGATVTITEQNTGFNRTVVTAENGRLSGAEPRSRRLHSRCRAAGFATVKQHRPRADRGFGDHARFHAAGRRTSGAGARSLPKPRWSRPRATRLAAPFEPRDRGDSLELPQHHRVDAARPGHHAEPGRLDVRRRAGGRERHAVAAERLSDRRDVQQRRPAGRQPGTQVRMVLDNIDEYQVLTNQYSARVRRRRRRHHQHDHARRHQRAARPRLLVLPRRPVQRAQRVPAGRRAEARTR